MFGWMRYASPFEYALEGLLVSQMQGQCFLFDPQSRAGNIVDQNNEAVVCAEISGETWLLNLGCSPVGETSGNRACQYTGDTIRSDIVVLALIRVGSVVIMYLAMYFAKGER